MHKMTEMNLTRSALDNLLICLTQHFPQVSHTAWQIQKPLISEAYWRNLKPKCYR